MVVWVGDEAVGAAIARAGVSPMAGWTHGARQRHRLRVFGIIECGTWVYP